MATAATLRRLLESAFREADDGDKSLRDVLRSRCELAGQTVAGGSLESVRANGRQTDFAGHGPGQMTPAETADCWQLLIDQFGIGQRYLKFCASYGLEAFQQEVCPVGLPAAKVDPELTIASDRWTELCVEFEIDEGLVVGRVVGDETVFLWLMWHLVPATEMRSDRRELRTSFGGWRL